MEGPSLYLAQEQLIVFKGKKIQKVSGNSKIGIQRLEGQVVRDIFSWGKHLVFQYDTFALRVHFMLFGTFEATVDNKTITGDYKRAREPRLAFTFSNGTISLFSCSVKYLETADSKSSYDFSIDIMSPHWNSEKALHAMRTHPQEEMADVLLDQTIFSGVGNMIKNEVLFLCNTHPQQQMVDLSEDKCQEIIMQAYTFSRQFYAWRKEFVLLKHLRIHRKGTCPHCQTKLVREKTGKRNRWSYYCPRCQPLL